MTNMNADNKKSDDNLMELFPHLLIFGGIRLGWLGLDYGVWVLTAGIIWYSIGGLIQSFKDGYHKSPTLKIAKPIVQILVLVCALVGFFGILIISLIVLDYLILTPSNLDAWA